MAKKNLKTSSLLPSWLSRKVAPFILFFAGLILFANTIGHDYAVDDAIAIYDNEFTTEGIAGIPDLWKYDSFRGFFKEEGKENLVSGGRYRPLSMTLFAIEYQVFGDNPSAFHFFNVIWYALLITLLFIWLSGLFADKFPWRLAFLIALLFLAHPVHVEAVANIKGRDEILCLLLCLLSAQFFMKKPWLSGLFLLLAFTAKEMAVTAMVWIPMAYIALRQIDWVPALKKAIPLFGAFVIYMFIRTVLVGIPLMSETTMELMNNPFLRWDGSAMVPFTMSERVASVLTIFTEYVRLLVFPLELNHDYYPGALPAGSWSDVRVYLGLVLLLGLIFIALKNIKRPSVYNWSAAGYLAGFFVIGNVIFPIGTFMGERFLFMPSLFFIAALVFLIYEKIPIWVGFICFSIFLLFAIRTFDRNTVWNDDKTLFLHDIKTQPNSAKLRNAAAGVLLADISKLSEPLSQRGKIEDAKQHLEKAVEIHPLYKNAWLQLGNANYFLENYGQAERAYAKALEIDPGYTLAYKNMAINYRDYGKFLGEKKGDLDGSISYLKKAAEMQDGDPETLRLLGVAYGIKGDLDESIAYFQEALAADGDNADVWYNMGVALVQSGRQQEAREALSKAATLNPDKYNK